MLKYLRVRKIIRFNLFSTGAGKKCNRKKRDWVNVAKYWQLVNADEESMCSLYYSYNLTIGSKFFKIEKFLKLKK